MNCAFEDVWHSLVRLYHQLQHNALEKICQDNICKIQNKITITLNNEFALNVVETALLIQIQKHPLSPIPKIHQNDSHQIIQDLTKENCRAK